MNNMWRGRTLNPATMMYEFRDGSGKAIPAEVAQEERDMIDDGKQGTTAFLIFKGTPHGK